MNSSYQTTLENFKTKSFSDVNSVIHKYGGDPRIMLVAPCALLMQVAHPTVSAGVKEHSDYLNNPWERLLRTVDFVYVMTHGEPKDMADMGEAIKNIHKTIRGTKSDGTKYSALEPEAYAWVHATLAYFFVKGNELFGQKLSDEETEQYWKEWKQVGRLIHVSESALPDTWKEFEIYFNNMTETRLQKTPEVTDLLRVLKNPPPPPMIKDLDKLKIWNKTISYVTNFVFIMISGTLPENAKKLLGLKLNENEQFVFDSVVKGLKLGTPIINKITPYTGKFYLKLRSSPINKYYNIKIW